jgi:hypothetical protein
VDVIAVPSKTGLELIGRREWIGLAREEMKSPAVHLLLSLHWRSISRMSMMPQTDD